MAGGTRSRRGALALTAALTLPGAALAGVARTAAPAQESQEAPAGPPARVLVVSATAGFTHDSIPFSREVIDRLGRESGAFETTHLPDLGSLRDLTADTLAAHQAVFFLNTSGELPLDGSQRQALVRFVSGGGGFLGAHAATDTLYSWPEYGELVGAYFREHPWTQPVTVAVPDESHPLTAGLGTAFDLTEEVYTFRTAPRAEARVLLRLDPASVGMDGTSGSTSGVRGDVPLAWCAPFGAGRSFYSALGHFDAVWQDAHVQRLLLAALRWTTGQLSIDPALTRSP